MAIASRNMILGLLIVGVALAVFYMMDPTMGGLLKKRRYEYFEDMPVIPEDGAAPSMSGQMPEMFESGTETTKENKKAPAVSAENVMNGTTSPSVSGFADMDELEEGFATLSPSPMPFPEGNKPANCYPKNQLTPQELLPSDPNSKWSQMNPMGQGDISGKNFLTAGALIGVNTIGQSLRNANQQLRAEPPCPQQQVSIWNQSTIEPDLQRRPLE